MGKIELQRITADPDPQGNPQTFGPPPTGPTPPPDSTYLVTFVYTRDGVDQAPFPPVNAVNPFGEAHLTLTARVEHSHSIDEAIQRSYDLVAEYAEQMAAAARQPRS